MPRQSSAPEEKARDLLLDFLQCLHRRPIAALLNLLFPSKVPDAFSKASVIDLHSELPAIGRSRVDLALECDHTILLLEVKVAAAEQLGQYIKYRDYFRHQGYTVHVAGLINRLKRPGCKNDNEPFFQSLGIPRLLWSEVLGAFQKQFGSTLEFQAFRQALRQLDTKIGEYSRDNAHPRTSGSDLATLARDTAVLTRFFEALGLRFPGWEVLHSKYGNAPYSLFLGKPEWGPLFNESSSLRIVLGFNNGRKTQLYDEPYFAPGLMLWDRTWHSNKVWFLDHHVSVANHFRKLGFEIVRNLRAHRNTPWRPPYSHTDSLFFANAFWEKHFSLRESEYCRLGWDRSLARLEQEIRKLARMTDALQPTTNG